MTDYEGLSQKRWPLFFFARRLPELTKGIRSAEYRFWEMAAENPTPRWILLVAFGSPDQILEETGAKDLEDAFLKLEGGDRK